MSKKHKLQIRCMLLSICLLASCTLNTRTVASAQENDRCTPEITEHNPEQAEEQLVHIIKIIAHRQAIKSVGIRTGRAVVPMPLYVVLDLRKTFQANIPEPTAIPVPVVPDVPLEVVPTNTPSSTEDVSITLTPIAEPTTVPATGPALTITPQETVPPEPTGMSNPSHVSDPTVMPEITSVPELTQCPTPMPDIDPVIAPEVTEAAEDIQNPEYTYEDLSLRTMYAIDDVNIRTLPSTKGEIIGDLDEDEGITVTGRCNETGWYRVEYGDVTAYVSNKYLTEVKPEKKNEKVIYLTFDDGPSKYTPKLLEILDKYNVKATFFVVTHKKYTYLIKDIYEAGHSIGVHTASHNYAKIYANEEAYFKDLYKAQDVIYEQIGVRPTIIRFPGGSSNKVSIQYNKGIMTRLTKAVEEKGFTYFDWNADSNDANGGSADTETVIATVKNKVAKKQVAVVLQHDTHEFSVNAVEEIILWGLENGYVFKTLDENSPTAHHKVNN